MISMNCDDISYDGSGYDDDDHKIDENYPI